MDDLAEKLNQLLSSPEGMEKIKSVAAMFGAADESGAAIAAEPKTNPANAQKSNTQNNGADTLSALISSFQPQNTPKEAAAPGLDAGMFLKLAPILAKLSSANSDPRVQLLESLRPILGKDRQETLEMAVTFLKLSKLTDFMELL